MGLSYESKKIYDGTRKNNFPLKENVFITKMMNLPIFQ